MAKRFIDTDLFRKPLMRGLEAPYKALWVYLLCECDHAGVWDVELDVATMRLGMKLDPTKVLEKFNGALIPIDGGNKWWLRDFVAFQYGHLNPANKVHASVLAVFAKYGIDLENVAPCKDHTSPLQGAKDKDKDKDNSGEKERAAAPTDLPFTSPEFAQAVSSWERHRAEIKHRLTPETRKAWLKKCEALGEADAIAAIEHSIANGWTGMFAPKADERKPLPHQTGERKDLIVDWDWKKKLPQ